MYRSTTLLSFFAAPSNANANASAPGPGNTLSRQYNYQLVQEAKNAVFEQFKSGSIDISGSSGCTIVTSNGVDVMIVVCLCFVCMYMYVYLFVNINISYSFLYS